MAVVLTEEAYARMIRAVKYYEAMMIGSGGRDSQRAQEIQPFVTVRITAAIGSGFYRAEEVRLQDNGFGVITWNTFTGNRIFDNTIPIFERNFTTGIPLQKIVTITQSQTIFPNSVTVFKRPVTWMFDIGGGAAVITAQVWTKISSPPPSGDYLAGYTYNLILYRNGFTQPATTAPPFYERLILVANYDPLTVIPVNTRLFVVQIGTHFEGIIPTWL